MARGYVFRRNRFGRHACDDVNILPIKSTSLSVKDTAKDLTDSSYTIDIDYWSRQIVIENNTFRSTQGGVAIRAWWRSGKPLPIRLTLTGNTFINVGPSLPAIFVGVTRAASITRNTFLECTSASLIRLSGDYMVTENRFINNTAPDCYIDLFDGTNDGTEANRNYWDTQDIHSIKAVICDCFMNTFRPCANITDYYTSADMTTLVSRPDADDFRFKVRADLNAVVVGGVVTSSSDTSVLTNSNMTVFVNRSIIVQPGVGLNLTAARFEFAENRGVDVRGK